MLIGWTGGRAGGAVRSIGGYYCMCEVTPCLSCTLRLADNTCEAEIADSEAAVFVDQEVTRLDVAMNNVAGVEKIETT